jgi:predicted tellurium resistance membrane protein TerC
MNLLSMESLVALLTLTGLEIVLGIDNIVMLAIVSGRVEPSLQSRTRRVGLLAAMVMRILLLLSISFIMKAHKPLFYVLNHGVSGRDIILMAGGLFLIWKSVREMHEHVEGPVHESKTLARQPASFSGAILQIMLLDLVFSLDSVITAVGMARHVTVMIAAIIIAILVMMAFADPISNFVGRHPTIRMLALAFLLLIGVLLLVEGVGKHIDRGYIYFAMAFSLFVELLNLRAGHRRAVAEKS